MLRTVFMKTNPHSSNIAHEGHKQTTTQTHIQQEGTIMETSNNGNAGYTIRWRAVLETPTNVQALHIELYRVCLHLFYIVCLL